MALSERDLARAADDAARVLGRAPGAVRPPSTGTELVRMVALAELAYEGAVAHEGDMRAAGLWTGEDQDALGTLSANAGSMDQLAAGISDDATPSVSDARDAVVFFAEAGALKRAFEQRIAAADACRQGGGHGNDCAASALALVSTPITPRLGGGGSVLPYVIGGALVLALGALALYAGNKRKHFLDGFYSPQPARIGSHARRGAPRRGADGYQLEVEE